LAGDFPIGAYRRSPEVSDLPGVRGGAGRTLAPTSHCVSLVLPYVSIPSRERRPTGVVGVLAGLAGSGSVAADRSKVTAIGRKEKAAAHTS